ncbi:hypothetical protein AB0E01_21500 [Nocardia vinacea]|uniref:hypothetical protein n=1 Tax=Nocardia vinacea TaxID=96468 RepID=UPI0033D37344
MPLVISGLRRYLVGLPTSHNLGYIALLLTQCDPSPTPHARPISDQSYPSVADEQEISVCAKRGRRRSPQQVDSLPLGIGPYLDPLDLVQDQAELVPVEHCVAVPVDTPHQTGVGLPGAQPVQRFVRIVTETVFLGMVDVLYNDV